MGKIFNLDSPLIQFLSKASNLMLLNILWIVCCIPIITIGASTVAMYTVTIHMVRDTGDEIIKPFFKAFIKDFWKSTGTFLILVVIAVIVTANAIFSQKLGSIVGVIVLVPVVLFLLAVGYVFPLLAQFDNSIFHTLKNAVIMCLVNSGKSIIVLLINCLPILIALIAEPLFWRTFIVWFLIGLALIAYLVTKVLTKVFDQYIDPKERQESGESVIL